MAVLVGSHAIALAGGSGGASTAWRLVVISAALPPMITIYCSYGRSCSADTKSIFVVFLPAVSVCRLCTDSYSAIVNIAEREIFDFVHIEDSPPQISSRFVESSLRLDLGSFRLPSLALLDTPFSRVKLCGAKKPCRAKYPHSPRLPFDFSTKVVHCLRGGGEWELLYSLSNTGNQQCY